MDYRKKARQARLILLVRIVQKHEKDDFYRCFTQFLNLRSTLFQQKSRTLLPSQHTRNDNKTLPHPKPAAVVFGRREHGREPPLDDG